MPDARLVSFTGEAKKERDMMKGEAVREIRLSHQHSRWVITYVLVGCGDLWSWR